MRPLQGRRLCATLSGGVAPGYYLVPLQGAKTYGFFRNLFGPALPATWKGGENPGWTPVADHSLPEWRRSNFSAVTLVVTRSSKLSASLPAIRANFPRNYH